MDFMFFINALLRKKWVIIVCTLAGVGAAFLFTFTKKNVYLSAATYSTGFTMKQQVKMSTDDGFNFFEIDQRFKNVIETFKSPVVICMLSYDLMLHDLEQKRPFTVLTDKEKRKPEYMNVNVEKAKQILRQKRASKEILKAYDPEENKVYELIQLYEYDNESILDELTVDRVQGTDYLNILYKSENPEMSAYVVNTIGQEFISFFTSINTTRTVESADKLDSLAVKKKREVDEKTDQLRKFKEKFNSPDVADKSKAAYDVVKELQTQLSTEEGKLNTLTAELNSVNQKLAAFNSTATNNTSNNNTELLSLLQENKTLASELTKKGGPGSDAAIEAKMASNQKRIQQIQPPDANATDKTEQRKKKDDLLGDKISLGNSIEGEKSTISSLRSNLNKFTVITREGAGADVVIAQMQQEIDLGNKQYEQMIGSLQNAQNINVSPEINFKQTLLGQPALKPEHSHRKVIIGIGGIAALMLSSIWIVIMDFLDQSVRAPSIFNKLVNFKLLAVINKIDLKNKFVYEYFDIHEDSRTSKDNIFVENMRKLRYEIENTGKKIILFTSTKSQEGKTTIIESLAYSFSLGKKKVLLIDSNFSNNSLTEKFDAKPVLDQFNLNEAHTNAEKMTDIISMTKIPNVDIIGCRKGNYSPDEILPQHNLLQNLGQLSSQYDYILMEGASLNYHADSKELSKYAEAIVAVFSAKSVIRQTDKESIKFLKTDKEKLIGAVLNGVEEDNINM
jgi:polysaccharide biosynthesis transport protein